MMCQSIITDAEYQQLLNGCLMTDENLIFEKDNFLYNNYLGLQAYNWISNKLEEKTKKRPCKFPRWVWVKEEGKECTRTIGQCLEESFYEGDYVLLTLDVPEERLLLSDFDLWHHPLNGWPLFDEEEESDAFEKWREDNHLSWFIFNDNEIKDCDKSLVKEARNKIIKTWDGIFDLVKENDYSRLKNDEKTIQGICWEFFLDDVLIAERYHVDEGLVIANKKRDGIYPYHEDEESCDKQIIEMKIN